MKKNVDNNQERFKLKLNWKCEKKKEEAVDLFSVYVGDLHREVTATMLVDLFSIHFSSVQSARVKNKTYQKQKVTNNHYMII